MTDKRDLNRREFLRYLLALPAAGAALALTGCGTQTPAPAIASPGPDADTCRTNRHR